MPVKSKAQRRKFAELLMNGDITAETYEEWNRGAGDKELPERLHPKTAKGAKGKTARKKSAAKKRSGKTTKKRSPAKSANATRKKSAKSASKRVARKTSSRKKTATRPR